MSVGAGGTVLAVFVANDRIPMTRASRRNIRRIRHRWRAHNTEMPIYLIDWWWLGCHLYLTVTAALPAYFTSLSHLAQPPTLTSKPPSHHQRSGPSKRGERHGMDNTPICNDNFPAV